MTQSPATPTLLFIPSFEIYGHVLLLLDLYEDAKYMFELSIQQRMGRIQSIIGLARSHAMLQNRKEADYFYKYIQDQLSGADKNNPFVEEAQAWLESKGDHSAVHDLWKWPYL